MLHGLRVQPVGQVLQQGLRRGRLGGHLDPHRLIEAQQPRFALQQLEPGAHGPDPMGGIGRGQHRGQTAPQLLQLEQVLRTDPRGVQLDYGLQLIEAALHHTAHGALRTVEAFSDGQQGLAQGPELQDLPIPLGRGQAAGAGGLVDRCCGQPIAASPSV